MTNATANFTDFTIMSFESRVDLPFRKTAVYNLIDDIHGEFGVVEAIRVFNDGTIAVLWTDMDDETVLTNS